MHNVCARWFYYLYYRTIAIRDPLGIVQNKVRSVFISFISLLNGEWKMDYYLLYYCEESAFIMKGIFIFNCGHLCECDFINWPFKGHTQWGCAIDKFLRSYGMKKMKYSFIHASPFNCIRIIFFISVNSSRLSEIVVICCYLIYYLPSEQSESSEKRAIRLLYMLMGMEGFLSMCGWVGVGVGVCVWPKSMDMLSFSMWPTNCAMGIVRFVSIIKQNNYFNRRANGQPQKSWYKFLLHICNIKTIDNHSISNLEIRNDFIFFFAFCSSVCGDSKIWLWITRIRVRKPFEHKHSNWKGNKIKSNLIAWFSFEIYFILFWKTSTKTKRDLSQFVNSVQYFVSFIA